MGDRLTGNTIKGDGENKIIFFKGGGHNHDGISSTLIDSTKYSIFDFNFGLTGSDQSRVRTQVKNKNQLQNYIIETINNASLEPSGIRLKPSTITSDLLSADFMLVDQTIASNGYIANANDSANATGWAIYSNGFAEFQNVLVRGAIEANSGKIANFTITSQQLQSNVIQTSNGITEYKSFSIDTPAAFSGEPSVNIAISQGNASSYFNQNSLVNTSGLTCNLLFGSNGLVVSEFTSSLTGSQLSMSDGTNILTLYSNAYIKSDTNLLLGATGDYTRIFGGSSVSLSANTGVLVIGNPTANHIAIDGDDIQAKSNGTSSDILNLNRLGGIVDIGGQTRMEGGNNVTLSSNTGFAIIGNNATQHIAIDANEIQSKSNGTTGATLFLNDKGGDVDLANGTLTTVRGFASVIIAGALTTGSNIAIGGTGLSFGANTGGAIIKNSDGDTLARISLSLGVYGQSLTGGRNMMVISNGTIGYNSASSIRFKEDISNYSFNEEGILSLQPVRFKYKEGFSAYDGDERPWSYGFIAEDVESAGVTEILQYDSEGKPDYIAYDMLPVLHHQVLRSFKDKIKELEDRLKALEGV